MSGSMKEVFQSWFSPRSRSRAVSQDPQPLIRPATIVEELNGRYDGVSKAEVLSLSGKGDADRMVEAAVVAAQVEVARLTVEAPEIQAKLASVQTQLRTVEDQHKRAVAESEALQTQLRARATRAEARSEALQTQLQAMEDRATRAEGNSLRCHQEFFVFQTNAVQQIRHLQDVARVSQQASADDSAVKAEVMQKQNIINDLQEQIQKQELGREEEKQELLKEMWEQQQIVESLQAKEETNENTQKQKEVQKVPLIDDRRMDSGGQGMRHGGMMHSGRFSPILGSRTSQVARHPSTGYRDGRARHRSPASTDYAPQPGKEALHTRCRAPESIPSRPRSPISASSRSSNFEPLGGSLSSLAKSYQEIEQAAIDSRSLRQTPYAH